MNHELPDLQVGFRKGRGTRDQSANICWIVKKQDNYRKASTSALLTIPKPLTVWITTNGEILKGMVNARPPYLPPVKPISMSRNKLEPDM